MEPSSSLDLVVDVPYKFYNVGTFEHNQAFKKITIHQDNAYFYDDVTVYGTFTNYSDSILKESIFDIDSNEALSKMKLLNGLQYEFKQGKSFSDNYIENVKKFRYENNIELFDTIVVPKLPEGKQFGFVAQDVIEVYPDLVEVDSITGFYTINYLGFIPILWESVKAQNELISEFNTKVEALEAQLISQKSAIMEDGLNSVQEIPNSFEQNNPNPFTENTIIKYQVSDDVSNAVMYIFDMNGKLIDNHVLNNGVGNKLLIAGNTLTAGMYIYTMVCDGVEVGSKRMILTK